MEKIKSIITILQFSQMVYMVIVVIKNFYKQENCGGENVKFGFYLGGIIYLTYLYLFGRLLYRILRNN